MPQRTPKLLTLSVLAILAAGVSYSGIGLGVAGGAHLRETGEAFIGEAEQFWLEVCVLVSVVFAFFRATRWASVTLIAAYVLALAAGYWAGYHWGNFVGWHPD